MRSLVSFAAVLLLAIPPGQALADAPESLEVRCDVDRKEFRRDAAGLTPNDPVIFRFYDMQTGGTQCGPDHEAAVKNILVFKAKTDRVDGERPRKFARVEAVIPGQCGGDPTTECQVESDCPATETCDPPELCPGEETWLELEANNNIQHCNFSAGARCQGGPFDGSFCKKTSQCQGSTCAAPERRRRVESVPFAQVGTATDLECTDCVCSEEIGPDCVTGAHVLDGSICTADIGDGCITGDKLAPDVPQDITVRVFNDTDRSIPSSSAETTLTFNQEQFDTDSMHDTVTNSELLTANTAGTYYIFANVQWDFSPTGYRALIVRQGGTLIAHVLQQAVTEAGIQTTQSIGTVFALGVGDTIKFAVVQTSGGPLDVQANSIASPVAGMVRLP